MAGKLSHVDAEGRARMVDVGDKADTDRLAVAEGFVRMGAAAREAIAAQAIAKGDVLQVARIAGIQGAKKTAELIPLCHPLPLDGVEVELRLGEAGVHIRARVRTRWRTGVEMEALTAVSAAALTVYDMVKAVDREMRIEGVRLLEKHGGRSGSWRAEGLAVDGAGEPAVTG
jgi:cyclic pyranopterin monophosphate synthase